MSAGLGDIHGLHHSNSQRKEFAGRVCFVGRLCSKEGPSDRREQTYDYPIGASFAAVGAKRLLRQSAVLKNQRRASGERQSGN